MSRAQAIRPWQSRFGKRKSQRQVGSTAKSMRFHARDRTTFALCASRVRVRGESGWFFHLLRDNERDLNI
jgi:hypothetical protein